MELEENETSFFTGIDKNNVEKIRVVHECVAELLKHFWNCYPPTRPGMKEKVFNFVNFKKKFILNLDDTNIRND